MTIEVLPSTYFLAHMVLRHPKVWITLGNVESKLIPELQDQPITSPIYICGLARSGSTILLELLNQQPGATTHRYQDYPFLFTPYWWNTLLRFTKARDKQKRERAHGDGIWVTGESPDAMEEILWNAFAFRNDFEPFYRDHIKKLLLARKATRYLCKNNYNVMRMERLSQFFPDARFIIPIRKPATHIASLMRQHQRFSEVGKIYPRIPTQMSLAGHFEFGLDRHAIDVGDSTRLHDINKAWENGEEVRGWALYWDMIYAYIYRKLPELKERALVIQFETLCDQPAQTLRTLTHHARFSPGEEWIKAQAKTIRAPDYYESPLTENDLSLIEDITAATARLFYP